MSTAEDTIFGPARCALESLSKEEVSFLQHLPKAELHAHLNGSIPIRCLQRMAKDHSFDESSEAIQHGIKVLEEGAQLRVITDFFELFPAIYALTSKPATLSRATNAVLDEFLSPINGDPPQCQYLELRTTPRKTAYMTRIEYLETVLSAMDRFPIDRCALIVSVDWRMSVEDAMDTLNAALVLKKSGKRIVGMDLCGDFNKARPEIIIPVLKLAREAGLSLTVHIAESALNPQAETDALLNLRPSRLGHATFLSDRARDEVRQRRIPIELCLSSNILCKTVSSLNDHHIISWVKEKHPICVCTDDILPFRTSLIGEYSLLLAKPPLGLGLSKATVAIIAETSMKARFLGSFLK